MSKILAINPGNTSTKIGLFEQIKLINLKIIRHNKYDLDRFGHFTDQLDYRLEAIGKFIRDNNIDISGIDYFIGRGGLLKPLVSGLYKVNHKMIEDLKAARYGEHGSNLGALIAYEFADRYKKKAYILDPVCVDELDPVARLSGHPKIPKTSVFHALNQKRVARKASGELGRKYEEVNLIVAHMGSGISTGLHKEGMVVDVNHAIDGEGPFGPERSGGLPVGAFLRYVFDNRLGYQESFKMIYGRGGMFAYLGTNDFKKVMELYDRGTDNKVNSIIEAMAYQISKSIVSLAAPVSGKVEGIVLTGGLAHSDTFMNLIRPKIEFISKNIFIYPGEDELQAMAEGVILGLKGEIKILEYK